MTARYPSLPYPPLQPSGSIVERAGKVLEEEQQRAAVPSSTLLPSSVLSSPVLSSPVLSNGALSNPALSLAQLPELEQRVRHLREQLQDMTDELTHALERLPAIAPASVAGPVVDRPPPVSSPGVHLEGASLPSLRSAEASPGNVARTALGLVNDGSSPAQVLLRVTSLLNAEGDELPSAIVSFSPNPTSVAGGEEQPVQVIVRVPSSARPGSYAGLVQAIGLAATRAVMVVDVRPAPSSR